MKRDDAAQTWDLLDQIADRFDASWRDGDDPPQLQDFLPEEQSLLRHLVLVELIKIDIEYRFRHRGEPKYLESYVEEFPELREAQGLPCDLIFEEYQVRRRLGEAVEADEYVRRFPENESFLRRRMKTTDVQVTTSRFASKQETRIEAGQTVDDFELLMQLGKGAFATVFLARQLSLGRMVAVKISSNAGTEPQTLAQLDHPNIVRVFDQRILPDGGERLLYMQHLPGGTLAEVIDQAKRLPLRERSGKVLVEAIQASLEKTGQPDSSSLRRMEATPWTDIVCRIGAQLALALQHAHEKGVLHRDVKPANVLLTAEGSPQLADFNISFSDQVEGVTAAAYFGGSLAYMSPEQLEAANPSGATKPEDLDAASDIYSLAVLLWELLYGSRPFVDEEVEGGWMTTLEEMAERRHRCEIYLPAEGELDPRAGQLTEVLRRCLLPDPKERIGQGLELARELLLCLHPTARKLLRRGQGGWRRVVAAAPTMSFLTMALLPNALAGAFNFAYNKREIIDPLSEAGGPFMAVQFIINGIFFPVGLFLVWWFGRHIGVAMRRQAADGASPLAATARREALRLGHAVAIIGIVEWAIAGMIYPVLIHHSLGNVPPSLYFHFFASLVISGFIAAAYPFFAIAFLAVRVYFPALLSGEGSENQDETDLVRLARRAPLYLFFAIAVPVGSVLLLVLSGSENQGMLIALCVMGLVGAGVAFWAYRAMERDLNALIIALKPIDSTPFGTDTVESFYV